LLVYWVHIELVYGRWFGAWKESLGNLECGVIAAIVIAAMLGLSVLRSRWNRERLMALVSPWFSYTPRRVSGD
jgi:ABC-type nitrate/sulfonate/bicarbonate transport system permease component